MYNSQKAGDSIITMKVIVINGPMGVGKTTVGKYIADSNPGTAFIDGDWCLDLHPFIGNRETKEMAIDNILHMTANYMNCSECRMIVLVWLMDESWVRDRVADGIRRLGGELISVVLTCDEDTLRSRFTNDKSCGWRTDEWLSVSLRSLEVFTSLEDTLDTSGMSVEQTAGAIMNGRMIR